MAKRYTPTRRRVAIVYPGDRQARRAAAPERSKVPDVFAALARFGLDAEPAVYHDDFCDEVRHQLLQADAALVWVNPIEGGRDRSILDAMLREVAASGVFVSAHPEVILKLGTKEVLYATRDIGWGCDTHLYRSMGEMRRDLPRRLEAGAPRVLKQHRGNGGVGVWKVGRAGIGKVRVRHAKRGCSEEEISLEAFFARCEPYFEGEGRVIDQAYQPRLPEGTIRCYLVHGRVVGFGHQAINALHPETAEPGPRLYHPPTTPEFQALKHRLEGEWLPAAQRRLEIETHRLPVLWDCDFLLGPKTASGEDSYVLCEINVSSVSPFPDSALDPLGRATLARIEARGHAGPTSEP
jgi:glutathione synthase/RimK-type ligase-like ATP-grasp enzyme